MTNHQEHRPRAEPRPMTVGEFNALSAHADKLEGEGEFARAEEVWRWLDARFPDVPAILFALGRLRWEQGDQEGALELARRTWRLRPEHWGYMEPYVCMLFHLERHDEIAALCAGADPGKPSDLDLCAEIGARLNGLGARERVMWLLAPFARANHALATCVGFACLALGRSDEGIEHLRWSLDQLEVPGRAWDGRSRIDGCTVLVLSDGLGLGDVIHFARYLLPLAAAGAKVVLRCPPRLKALLLDLPATVIGDDEACPAHDRHCALETLFALLGPPLDVLPDAVPYLHARPERVARWRERLRPDGRLLVGVVWQCSLPPPGFVADRGFPLRHLAGIAALPGVRLVALQRGFGVEQLLTLPPGMAVEDPGPDFDAGPDAFLDTAAVMECCDLILTCDTSTAHLAGALGRPVWVALKHAPDWRWFRDRADSPWYPTMRLFRQEREGDWAPVFARMTEAVRVVLEERSR